MPKLTNFLKYIFIGFVLTNTFPVIPCTVFMANDGKNVWVGANEDEVQATKYRMWFYPAKHNSYGYAIVTDLNLKLFSTIKVKSLAYLIPQIGLNEHGLYIDYTAIDEIPIVRDPQKKDNKKDIATALLKNCKTVEEALAFINQLNLVGLSSAQLFIGDATGNYATVTGAYVVKKTENNFALTNYCINDGKKHACHRRDVATHYLNLHSTPFQLGDITSILQKAAQKYPYKYTTNLSLAVNLKATTINLYYKHDFSNVATISLTEELKKGKHHRDIKTFFPENIVPILEKTYKINGMGSTIARYKKLRETSFDMYNFKNNDALNLAVSWIDKGASNDALQFLECLNKFDSTNTSIETWMGVANKKMNKMDESNKYFAKVLSQNPNDYLATIWGKQEAGKITFKLTDFEAAERVWLVGEFTDGLKNPIKMMKENGYWSCEVTLPKGETTYRFVVNNSYYTDEKNVLHTGKDEHTESKIYVW